MKPIRKIEIQGEIFTLTKSQLIDLVNQCVGKVTELNLEAINKYMENEK